VSGRRAGRPSLLAALFGRTGLILLVVIASVGVIALFTARDRVDEVYDSQLIIGANVLRALMSDELREQGARGAEHQVEVDDSALLSKEDRQAFDNYAEWRMFRVWRRGRITLRSDTGPPAISPPPPADGFSDVRSANGDRWRVYTLRVPIYDIAVQVGERTDIRAVLVREIAVGTAGPLLLLIPLIAGLLWLSLRDGLGALRLLMTEIGRRSVRDLSALPLEPWPGDLHPLVRAINRLFARIERAVQLERSFLDSAAHQLRTPLAAVKLQSQMIARESDPKARAAMIRRLTESVDRAAAMTDSLLTLARLEARGRTADAPPGDLRVETVAAIADLAPLAARRGIGLSFDGPEAAPCGDPLLLRLIASNLVENALHHAPAGSEVEIQLSAGPGDLRLRICDHGPGVAPGERDNVLRRFYRGPTGSPGGAGLGLSIVAEAVRLLDGRLALKDRPDGGPGLCVDVYLPTDRNA
jgi:signal transduction histidine kinase